MKICNRHNEALMTTLESLGWPPRSFPPLYDCQAIIIANAVDQNPNSAMEPGCPICTRPTVTEGLQWIKEAAMSVTWASRQPKEPK